MKTLLINLARNPERKDFALKECARVGLAAEVLQATDGKLLDEDWFRRNATPEVIEKIKNPQYRALNLGAVACADSHRRCYSEIQSGQENTALILEDDFFWLHSPRVVQAALNHLNTSGYDVVLLGFSPRHPIPASRLHGEELVPGFILLPYQAVQHTAGAYAYFLSRKGAVAFSAVQAHLIDREADDFALEQARHGERLKFGVIFPPLVHSGLFDSTLWPKNLKTGKQKLKRLLSIYSVRFAPIQRVYAWALARRLKRTYVEAGG